MTAVGTEEPEEPARILWVIATGYGYPGVVGVEPNLWLTYWDPQALIDAHRDSEP